MGTPRKVQVGWFRIETQAEVKGDIWLSVICCKLLELHGADGWYVMVQ